MTHPVLVLSTTAILLSLAALGVDVLVRRRLPDKRLRKSGRETERELNGDALPINTSSNENCQWNRALRSLGINEIPTGSETTSR